MTAGGQKGVDGLIILDLITLARNRAVDVANLGHRGRFPTNRRQGQSALLLREADHVVRLAAEDVASHLRLTPGAEAALVAATGAADGEMAEPDEFISTAAEEDAERSLGDV